MSDSFSFENSEDLDIFLRVLAEEVTKSAKVSLTEEKDEEQVAMKTNLKKSLSKFQEAEEDDAEDSVEPDDASPPPPPPSDDEEEEEADGSDPDEGEAETTSTIPEIPTPTDVIGLINIIRSAPAAKGDKRRELSAYLDVLDDKEKRLMYYFFDQVGKVMHGQVAGSSAGDPSEPPLSYKIGSDNDLPAQAPAPAQGQQDSPAKGDEPADQPPVRVGGSQRVAEIRERVKQLMMN